MSIKIQLGCHLSFDLPAPTPMILLLNIHPTRVRDLDQPDHLTTILPVAVETYADTFNNRCARVIAPAGRFTVTTEATLRDSGRADPIGTGALQHPVEDLPVDTLAFLLPSRYCDSDLLSEFAWSRFGNTPLGWHRVQAVCNFAHAHIAFGYQHSRPTRTAKETLEEGVGVCRDYTYLAIALCRSLNIPARYCTGYISDIGQQPPYAPMDFCAWMEVYLGDTWWVFDPRNNDTRYGRVLVARGRDAADVPLTHSFGPHQLREFKVWIDEAGAAATNAA